MSHISPTPGTPQTATKAYAAAVLGFLASFIIALTATLHGRTDLDTMKAGDWLVVILGAAATAIAAGGGAYQAKNKPTSRV